MNTWWSFLLVTSDGGRSWKQARHAPSLADADLLLVTANEGWLFGLSEDSPFKVLSVTRDGANSWQTVTLEAPKEIASANCSVMDLPTFEDARHGFLHVNCLTGEPPESKLAMVLFATEDGGRTWRKNRMITNLDYDAREQYGLSIVVGSDWIFATFGGRHPDLFKVGAGATINIGANASDPGPPYSRADEVSFATPAQGWAIVGNGVLMSTTDGGATWTTLTPGPQPHIIDPVNAPAR